MSIRSIFAIALAWFPLLIADKLNASPVFNAAEVSAAVRPAVFLAPAAGASASLFDMPGAATTTPSQERPAAQPLTARRSETRAVMGCLALDRHAEAVSADLPALPVWRSGRTMVF